MEVWQTVLLVFLCNQNQKMLVHRGTHKVPIRLGVDLSRSSSVLGISISDACYYDCFLEKIRKYSKLSKAYLVVY